MFSHSLGAGAELRILERRHAPAFHAIVIANRAYLAPWIGWAATMQTVADAEAVIDRGLTRFAEDALPYCGLWQDGELVGGTVFFPLERPPRATEIGYWMAEHAAGRGLMRRAVTAMLGYCFDELGLNRVGLQAAASNTRSRALAERLGFQLEGIRRQSWVSEGNLIDMAGYAMLASDWAALRN